MSAPATDHKCKICEVPAGEVIAAKELTYGTNEPFDFFQCSSCGCLQIKKIPEDITKYYPQDFYSYSAKKRKKNHPLKTYLRKSRARFALEGKGFIGSFLHRFKKPSDILSACADIGMKTSDSILDVGGGTGDYAWQLRTFGFDDIMALDKFIEGDVHVDGVLLAKKGEIFSVDGKFDLITFHHSLEHMEEQLSPLQHAKKLLKPGGKILVRIPTVSSDAWEEYGINWIALDVPRHFFIHSHKSITLLAQQAGLKVDRLWCDSTFEQYWVSEQFKRGISRFADNSFGIDPEKSIFSKAQIEDFHLRAEEANRRNRGDTICLLLEPAQINKGDQ